MTTNGSNTTLQNHCGSPCAIKCWQWDVTPITMLQLRTQIKYAVLILNRPLVQSQHFIKNFWNNAFVRMTVDGGTTRWDKYIANLTEDMRKTIKKPDLITGDFDSISAEILDKYKKKGCKIIHTPDQSHTDFTKALIQLNIYCHNYGIEMDHVVAMGQSSGRIDQVLANIQTLYLAKQKRILHGDTRLYMMSDDALSWLLYPGDHVINIPEETRTFKRSWCSLIPVGETCQYVTTTGLKWNLDNQPLKFGELVSTSNTFDGSEKVTIKCSHPLLWSMRIPSVMGESWCNIPFTLSVMVLPMYVGQ